MSTLTTPATPPDVSDELSEEAFLAAYDPTKFGPVGLTADVCLLTVRNGLLSILLIQRAGHPFQGRWALPGGFVEAGETGTEAAWRELREETGLDQLPEGTHLEQLRCYTTPGRDPRLRVVSDAHVAFAPRMPDPVAGSDAAAARWWPVGDLDGVDGPALAFDHGRIIADAVERARAKLEYSTLAAAFCEEPFTIADLHRIYEAVWGVELTRQGFQRKVVNSPGFVVGTDDELAVTGGRPARLYRRGDAEFLPTPIIRPDFDQRKETL